MPSRDQRAVAQRKRRASHLQAQRQIEEQNHLIRRTQAEAERLRQRTAVLEQLELDRVERNRLDKEARQEGRDLRDKIKDLNIKKRQITTNINSVLKPNAQAAIQALAIAQQNAQAARQALEDANDELGRVGSDIILDMQDLEDHKKEYDDRPSVNGMFNRPPYEAANLESRMQYLHL